MTSENVRQTHHCDPQIFHHPIPTTFASLLHWCASHTKPATVPSPSNTPATDQGSGRRGAKWRQAGMGLIHWTKARTSIRYWRYQNVFQNVLEVHGVPAAWRRCLDFILQGVVEMCLRATLLRTGWWMQRAPTKTFFSKFSFSPHCPSMKSKTVFRK